MIEHLKQPRGREGGSRANRRRSGYEEGIEDAVIARVEDGDGASGIDELDADEIESLIERGGAREGRIDAEDKIDVAVDVGEERGIVEECGAAGAFPNGVEGGFDGAGGREICGGGAKRDGLTEEEIDHGVNAPTDVIFDDGLAVGRGGGVDARREGVLLREGVPLVPRWGKREGIAVVGVELAEEGEALGVVGGECGGEAEAEWFGEGHGRTPMEDTSASLPMEVSDASARFLGGVGGVTKWWMRVVG